MTRIYVQQLGAVEDFRKSLLRWNKQRGTQDHKTTGGAVHGTQGDCSMDFELMEDMMDQIRARKAEIEELAGAAERSCQNVSVKMANPRLALNIGTDHFIFKVTRSFGSQTTAGYHR